MIAKQSINNKMIELARISRGLNQKELAEMIGVQQGTISKIEKEQMNVKEDILSKLSEVLEYPESFFYEKIDILSPYPSYYRKRKSLSGSDLACLEANLYIQKYIIKKREFVEHLNIFCNCFLDRGAHGRQVNFFGIEK